MPFIKVPGLKGTVFVPEDKSGSGKKNNCKDCFLCQMCSNDRCSICL